MLQATAELVDEILTSEASRTVFGVLESLGLQAEAHPPSPHVLILHRNGSGPLAAILCQGASLRDDRDAIDAVKALRTALPIIYASKSSRPRRESAIRRMGIHYFLSPPVESEELRLVLDTLVQSASSSTSFERCYTR